MQPFIHQYWAPVYAKHYASFEDLKKNKPCPFSWEACSLLRREGHRNNYSHCSKCYNADIGKFYGSSEDKAVLFAWGSKVLGTFLESEERSYW